MGVGDGIKGGAWKVEKPSVARATKASDAHRTNRVETSPSKARAAAKAAAGSSAKGAAGSAAQGASSAAHGATSKSSLATQGATSSPSLATQGAASNPSSAAQGATSKPARTERDFRGEAHKLYVKYASRQEGNVLIKRQMMKMMGALVKEGRFLCSSEEKLKKFVDAEFAKTDVNQDEKLSFEEFLDFFGRWLDESAKDMVDQNEFQSCKVEAIFMKYDVNHDFNITADELRRLVVEMHPPGLPKPPEEEVDACVKELMRLDVNRNGGISFEEFANGYNVLIERVHALHGEQRRKVMDSSAGFRGMIREDSERQILLDATKSKYDGLGRYKVWVCSEHDLPEAKARAGDDGKVVLFLDAPPGELDMPTTRYAAKAGGRCKVLNMQQICMNVAEKKLTEEEAICELRDTVLECMEAGQQLLLRLGHTAPDFMMSWNRKDLPLEFLTPDAARPGPLLKELHGMVQKPHDPAKFRVSDGYALVITSCFNMSDYHEFLRAKLPLQYMQVVQVMSTLADVAEVLKDGGLPKSEDDDVFAEMDRLANLL